MRGNPIPFSRFTHQYQQKNQPTRLSEEIKIYIVGYLIANEWAMIIPNEWAMD